MAAAGLGGNLEGPPSLGVLLPSHHNSVQRGYQLPPAGDWKGKRKLDIQTLRHVSQQTQGNRQKTLQGGHRPPPGRQGRSTERQKPQEARVRVTCCSNPSLEDGRELQYILRNGMEMTVILDGIFCSHSQPPPSWRSRVTQARRLQRRQRVPSDPAPSRSPSQGPRPRASSSSPTARSVLF